MQYNRLRTLGLSTTFVCSKKVLKRIKNFNTGFFFVGTFSILVGGKLLQFALTRSSCGRNIGCCWPIPGALASRADGSRSIPGTRTLGPISCEDTGLRWVAFWFSSERPCIIYSLFSLRINGGFVFSGALYSPPPRINRGPSVAGVVAGVLPRRGSLGPMVSSPAI